MAGLEDYETTLKIEESIRRIVRSELESARPPTRIAEVVAIDRVNRKVTVIFTGELEEVVVPYLGTGPAVEGQFVRVGGTTHDRYVEDVVGESENESRIVELEKELARATQRAYCNAGPQNDFDLRAARMIPNNTPAPSASGGISAIKNVTLDATGFMTIQIEGMYEYSATLMVDAMRSNTANMWIRLRRADGFEYDHAKSKHDQLLSSGEYLESAPMTLVGQVYLKVDDKISVTGYSQNNTTVMAAGTTLAINLIDPA